MIDKSLIGCRIITAADRRRTVTGVVLPPAPRAITSTLRLAVDGTARPRPFIPDQWTITVLAGPVYSYGNLPVEHLASRTMLRVERRRQPARGQRPIAEYRLRRGTADLYAVADTKPMPQLSDTRADAWTRARTCHRCSKPAPRPFPTHTDGGRYCSPCREQIAVDHWTEQSRAAQDETALWARAVLDDPAAVLIAHDGSWKIRRIRAETIAGTVIADVRVRTFDDLSVVALPGDGPDEIAAREAAYAGSIGPAGYAEAAPALAVSRIIGWDYNCRLVGHGSSHVADIALTDVVEDRLALWSGVSSPYRLGDYYMPPRIPWDWTPRTYPPYSAHLELRRGPGGADRDPAAELRHLRTLIHLMAEQEPPQPTIYSAEPVRTNNR